MNVSMISDAFGEAASDPDQANMFMRLFYLHQTLGQNEPALVMQEKALMRRCFYRIVDPPAPAIRLLALMGPGNMLDNAPLEFVVDNSDIRLDLLYLLPDKDLPEIIPDHDIAIVALGESKKNRPLLARMEDLLAAWPRPVLNNPHRVLRCARDAACELLQGIPGLLVPETRRLDQEQARNSSFPITIRPVDSHSGAGLKKINSAAELDAYFEAFPDNEFYVSQYVDYCSKDGLFRKARIALIDGSPYICHLAISDDWVVHYIPASMQLNAQKRAEEAAMMEDFDRDFAARHRTALETIAERLGLDYVILDCGEMRDGRLLFFEADTRGWIHATDPVEVFPYKLKIMQKAFDAFRTMLANRIFA
jgi:glutathione synthase/RimK-type ligase-like ATP-grasp enzyme